MTPWNIPEEDPFDSLCTVITTHVHDWGQDERDAWLYGVIVGWDDEVLVGLQKDFKWSTENVERLKRLRLRFVAASKLMKTEN